MFSTHYLIITIPLYFINSSYFYSKISNFRAIKILKNCAKALLRNVATFLLLNGVTVVTKRLNFFFFYLGFLSRTLTNCRTAREGGRYFFNSSLHLDISRAITADSSPLQITSSRTRTGNLWFPSASC